MMDEIKYNHILDKLYFTVPIMAQELICKSAFDSKNPWLVVREALSDKADEVFKSKLEGMFDFYRPMYNDLIGNYVEIRTYEYRKKCRDNKEALYSAKAYHDILVDKVAYYKSLFEDLVNSGDLKRLNKIQEIFGAENVIRLSINKWNKTVDVVIKSESTPYNHITEKDVPLNTDEETLKGLLELMTKKSAIVNKGLEIKEAITSILGNSYIVDCKFASDRFDIWVIDKDKPSERHVIFSFGMNELDRAREVYINIDKELDNVLAESKLHMVCYPMSSGAYLSTKEVYREHLIDKVERKGCGCNSKPCEVIR